MMIFRLAQYELRKNCEIIDLHTDKDGAFNAKIVEEHSHRLSSDAKVYLCGHADWQNNKFADKEPEWLAEALSKLPRLRVLSILGCSLGRDQNTEEALLTGTVSSFASNLHTILGKQYDLHLDIYARVLDVKILENGSKTTLIDGSKDDDLNKPTHKRHASKLHFYWVGNSSKRKWVVYENPTKDTFALLRESFIDL